MSKRIPITISLPKETVQSIEDACKSLGMTRSEFFRTLIRKAFPLETVYAKHPSKERGGFWLLADSLGSDITLTDEDLREARNAFSKKWPRK